MTDHKTDKLDAQDQQPDSEWSVADSVFFQIGLDLKCLASPEGFFTKVNPSFTHVLGWSEAELLGRPFIELVHPDDRERTEREAAAIVEGRKTMKFINRYRCKDGSYKYLNWSAVFSPKINRLCASARDDTDSIKRQERERQMALSIIGEQQRQLDTLLDNLPGMAYRCEPDQDYTMRFVSKGCCDLTGYDPHDLLDNSRLTYAERVHPDDRERVWREVAAATKQNDKFQLTYRIITAKGAAKWVWEQGQPVNIDGHLYLEGFINDITDRVAAHHELEKLNRELEDRVAQRTAALRQSNEQLEQFAHIASHDLKEPLRKITAFGDLLRDNLGEQLAGENKEFLLIIIDAAQRMSRLISDLLQYSRITTHDAPFGAVDLDKVARQALGDLEVLVKETGANIEIDALPTVQANSAQMHQLLLNLIGNALKYRKPEVASQIRITANPQAGERVQFAIRDNGIGFEPKQAERILKPFHRLHGIGHSYDGTGIGLAICHKIVERHGGRLIAEGQPGAGATFRFDLPLA